MLAGCPDTENSIGTAGRGGVNNSGTPLAYNRSEERRSSLASPLATPRAYIGVKTGRRGVSTMWVGKPHTARESHRLTEPCHAGRSWRALPALATSGSGAPTCYTAPLVPLAHSSLCPAGKEKPPGGSCALHQPGSQSLKQKRTEANLSQPPLCPRKG